MRALTQRARDPLTWWEAAVIATYQVAVDWPAGTVALLVPHLIGERLIVGATSAMPVARLAVPDSAHTPGAHRQALPVRRRIRFSRCCPGRHPRTTRNCTLRMRDLEPPD
ncbi:hypothetical protein [Kitasatospora sp. NPDC018619]|uniref:hypothetical protein n=1 Tax=unclassified Kitasatospora TaxID=2633591 RepID=UPI0037982708